eukprot:365269-Chlamydomonas_euryale.AAC.4
MCACVSSGNNRGGGVKLKWFADLSRSMLALAGLAPLAAGLQQSRLGLHHPWHGLYRLRLGLYRLCLGLHHPWLGVHRPRLRLYCPWRNKSLP